MNKPKILLVMPKMPLDSGFLASKFIELSKSSDVHLLVWDSTSNISQFLVKHNLDSGYGKRIHRGVSSIRTAALNAIQIFIAVVFNAGLRKFFLSDRDNLVGKLKYIALYLPVFRIKPDIIHFEFATLAARVERLKDITKAKISVSFRGYDINYVGLDAPDYYNELWEHIDAAHFLGNDLKQRAVRRGYKAAMLEAIIPPGIDLQFFKPETGTLNTKPIILSVGRLNWKKGYEYGLQAAAILMQKGIDFQYRIVGAGPNLQALQFTISELGLTDNVKLIGNKTKEDIKSELESATVFLHPAISEGFCNAVIEAQAMGVPVVCTDADGLAENIANGVTGYIVPKWNVLQMADRLEYLLINKEKATQMGLAGIQRANALYGLDKQIDSWRQYYKKLDEL